MIPWTLHRYSVHRYPFSEIVVNALGVRGLTTLAADLPRRTWQTDQQSPWHALFYASFEEWHDRFDDLVRKVIAPIINEPFYYQRVPTFRVQLPGNTAVGEFHKDTTYNHPADEQTFWLPLTDAGGTSSVWIEGDDGDLYAPSVIPGQIVQFSAATRSHGNVINETGQARVSFDFRCLPVRLLPKTEGPPTKHTKLRFVPGGYYATEVIYP